MWSPFLCTLVTIYICSSVVNMLSYFFKLVDILRSGTNTFQNDFDFIVFENMPLTNLFSKMQQYIKSIDKVENWLRFRKLLKQIEAKDLMAYIDFIIKNEIPQNQIVAVYKKLFCKHG